MAQEHFALLKWPKNMTTELADLIGKPAILVLKLEIREEPEPRVHTIVLKEGWTKDNLIDECFICIQPVKTLMTKSVVKCLIPLAD